MKGEYLNVRMTPEEKKVVEVLARSDRRTLSDMVRVLISDGVKWYAKMQKESVTKAALKEANKVFERKG